MSIFVSVEWKSYEKVDINYSLNSETLTVVLHFLFILYSICENVKGCIPCLYSYRSTSLGNIRVYQWFINFSYKLQFHLHIVKLSENSEYKKEKKSRIFKLSFIESTKYYLTTYFPD